MWFAVTLHMRVNHILRAATVSCFLLWSQDTVSAIDTKGKRQTTASFYGMECKNLPMANGRPFKPEGMTCASWFYPLGTRLQISHGGKSVVVRVTDRGPAWHLVAENRLIDLSEAAFKNLSKTNVGLIAVTIKKLK